jgi:hypothetical protein
MRTAGAAALVALTTAVLVSGCAGSGGGDDDDGGGGPAPCESQVPGDPVSFANNIQPIYARSCALAGCHVPPVLNAGLDLSPAVAYAETVRVKSTQRTNEDRIRPGDPDRSYLFRKLTGDDITGVLMPQGCPGSPLNGAQCLTPDEIEAIRTWILECAPQN